MATKEQLEDQRAKALAFKEQQREAFEDNVKRLKRNYDAAVDMIMAAFQQKMAVADAALAKIAKELENATVR